MINHYKYSICKQIHLRTTSMCYPDFFHKKTYSYTYTI